MFSCSCPKSSVLSLPSPSSHTASKYLTSTPIAWHTSTPIVAAQLVKHAFTTSRLDYCSSIPSSLLSTVLQKTTVCSKLSCSACSPTPTPQITWVQCSVSITGYPFHKILVIAPQSSAQSCTLIPDWSPSPPLPHSPPPLWRGQPSHLHHEDQIPYRGEAKPSPLPSGTLCPSTSGTLTHSPHLKDKSNPTASPRSVIFKSTGNVITYPARKAFRTLFHLVQ